MLYVSGRENPRWREMLVLNALACRMNGSSSTNDGKIIENSCHDWVDAQWALSKCRENVCARWRHSRSCAFPHSKPFVVAHVNSCTSSLDVNVRISRQHNGFGSIVSHGMRNCGGTDWMEVAFSRCEIYSC